MSLFDPKTPGSLVAQLESHWDPNFPVRPMWVLACLGRVLPPPQPSVIVDRLKCHFVSNNSAGDVLICRAHLVRRGWVQGRLRIELRLEAHSAEGEIQAIGNAVLSSNQTPADF